MFWLAATLFHFFHSGCFHILKKINSTICHKFFTTIYSYCSSEVVSLSVHMSRFSSKMFFFSHSPLNHNKNLGCVHCGTQFKRSNLGQHTNRCSLGSQYCTQSPNFSTVVQTKLFLLLRFPQKTCKNQLHIFFTTVRLY